MRIRIQHFDPVTTIIPGQDGKGALYLGNIYSVSPTLLRNHRVGAVVTLLPQSPAALDEDSQVLKLLVEAEDQPDFNIKDHFQTCNAFIATNLQKTNVLVHCMAGVSRSASVVLAFLMHRGAILSDAIKIVKERRPIICPNPGFLKQLAQFDEQCQAERKVQADLQLQVQKDTQQTSKKRIPFNLWTKRAIRNFSQNQLRAARQNQPIKLRRA